MGNRSLRRSCKLGRTLRVQFAFWIAGFLLAVPPRSGDAQIEGPWDRLRVAEVYPDWFQIAERFVSAADAGERRLSRSYPGRVLRWGNLLALKLDNGKFVWLVDMAGPAGFGCCEVFRLDDYWPDEGLYVVEVGFGEASRTWLVSQRTTAVTEVRGKPRRAPFAPDLFVSLFPNTGDGGGVEVWEKHGTWGRKYRCGLLPINPVSIRWEAPGRAVLAGEDSAGKATELSLVRSHGHWGADTCRDTVPP